MNRWGYVEGNPVNLIDPTGQDPWYCDDCLCGSNGVIQNPFQTTEWEKMYGIAIAHAAARMVSRSTKSYYVWGANDKPIHIGETDKVPPPRIYYTETNDHDWWVYPEQGTEYYVSSIYERTGDKLPIVCADVPALSYQEVGIDLRAKAIMTGYDFTSEEPERDVQTLLWILEASKDGKHQWGDGAILEYGDIVTIDGEHSGVVASFSGTNRTDPDNIYIAQASYSQGEVILTQLSVFLRAATTAVYFGHPTYP
jgi:hypothetical protein